MPIRLNGFRGLTPKRSRFFRPQQSADAAQDCDVRTGALRPLFRPRIVGSVTASSKGLVALPDGESFIGLPTPTVQVNARNRSYFLDGTGRIGYATGNDDSASYLLGVPTPNKHPTVAVTPGSSSDMAEQVFLYTFVNGDGEQSDPLEVKVPAATIDATFTITVPSYTQDEIDTLFQGRDKTNPKVRTYLGAGLQARFISEHDLVAGTAITTTYKLGTNTLGEVIDVPEHSTLPPASGITSIAVMRGNFLAAAAGNTLYFSDVGVHNRWPAAYNRQMAKEILAIVPWVDLLYVFPKDSPPLVVTVPTPDVYSAYDTQIPWPCLSGPSAVNTGLGVLYAAKSGMVSLQGSKGALITKEILDEESFAEYKPSSIRAFSIDGVYQAYANGKPFTLDTQAMGGLEMTERTWNPSDVKVVESTAYGLRNGNVREYVTGGLRHSFRWLSSLARFENPTSMADVQVRADYQVADSFPHVRRGPLGTLPTAIHPVASPPLELGVTEDQDTAVYVTLYNEDGDKVSNTRVLTDSEPKSLAMGKAQDNLCVEIISATTVHSVTVAENGDILGRVVS